MIEFSHGDWKLFLAVQNIFLLPTLEKKLFLGEYGKKKERI